MKQYIEIRCRHCGAEDLVKNGRSENGAQRQRSINAERAFSMSAWKPGVKEQTEIQALSSSGIRDISRNRSVSKVASGLKKNPAEVNTRFMDFLNGLPPYELEIEIMAEADELWSYAGSKQYQRWTWTGCRKKKRQDSRMAY